MFVDPASSAFAKDDFKSNSNSAAFVELHPSHLLYFFSAFVLRPLLTFSLFHSLIFPYPDPSAAVNRDRFLTGV
jgi:hypothetical protein